jgi:HK97 family phage major capsid protein
MGLTAEKIRDIAKEVALEVIKTRDHGHETNEKAFLAMIEAARETARDAAAHKATPLPKDKGILAGRFMRAIAAGKGDPEKAAKFASRSWGTDDPMVKILEASDVSAGGVLVPVEYSNEIIELLREQAVFRSAGPRIIPMDTGSIMIPKITGGATASYIGESQNINPSEPAFGEINLTWKKLAAIVPMSNDVLRFAAASADAIVRDDAVQAMAYREDTAFLRGDGTQHTPKGLRAFTPAGNIQTAQTSYDLTKVTQDIAWMILQLRNGLSRMIQPAWFWSPRTQMYLMTVRDTNGNFAFRDEMVGGTFWGYPFYQTTVIPNTLGSGDKSEIQLADMADVLLGEAGTLEVSASDVAAYFDGSAVQAAFSKDLTVLRVLAHHDLQVRHEESLVMLDGVDWSPTA